MDDFGWCEERGESWERQKSCSIKIINQSNLIREKGTYYRKYWTKSSNRTNSNPYLNLKNNIAIKYKVRIVKCFIRRIAWLKQAVVIDAWILKNDEPNVSL